jgi:hypothetical protein
MNFGSCRATAGANLRVAMQSACGYRHSALFQALYIGLGHGMTLCGAEPGRCTKPHTTPPGQSKQRIVSVVKCVMLVAAQQWRAGKDRREDIEDDGGKDMCATRQGTYGSYGSTGQAWLENWRQMLFRADRQHALGCTCPARDRSCAYQPTTAMTSLAP